MPGSVGILTDRSARDEHTANTLIIFAERIGIEMKHEETIYHLRHRVCLRTHHMANINNYLCGLARQYRPVFDSGSIIVIVCEEWGPLLSVITCLRLPSECLLENKVKRITQ